MTMGSPSTTQVKTYPGTDEQVPQIRQWAVENVPAEVADAVGLVVTEAATNAILHSRSGLDGGTLTVAIRPLADGVRVTVTDQGSTAHRPDNRDPETGGRGQILMHAFAAACGVKGGPDGHTQWAEFRITPT